MARISPQKLTKTDRIEPVASYSRPKTDLSGNKVGIAPKSTRVRPFASGRNRGNNTLPRRIVTTSYDFSVETIVNQIGDSVIHLKQISDRPKFQRNYVWNDKQASLLIESIILNVPIPLFYFSEDENSNFDVMDGQQRILSIYRFFNNEFELVGLEVYKEFEGCTYEQLPKEVQTHIRLHILRCVVIRNESHPKIKYDVFERLNTNTVPLKPQEIRNCIYRGRFNDLLGELSNEDIWLLVRNRKEPDARLEDEEIILRFFSFVLQDRNDYMTPFKHWLNNTAIIGNKMTKNKLEELKNIWHETLSKTLILFEPNECFRQPSNKRFNKVLFDLICSSVINIDKEHISQIKKRYRSRYFKLFKNEEFIELIQHSTQSRTRVFQRFEIWDTTMSDLEIT